MLLLSFVQGQRDRNEREARTAVIWTIIMDFSRRSHRVDLSTTGQMQ